MGITFDNMSPTIFAVGAVILYLLFRFLNLASYTASPLLFFKGSQIVQGIIKACPLLTEPYIPPLLWGKSGHIQTVIYAKLGRIKSPFPSGQRLSSVMPDGATMTFDVFEPLAEHSSGGDYTMCVCPGIANSSESVYIRTFVDHAQRNGYRVAVLNHLGALKNIKLTAPRIFSYGETDEYARMIEEIERVFPNSKLLSIGFSMGGNLICKYLGDSIEHQRKFICAMSICQGYDAMAAMPHFTGWDLLLRFYNWAMTQNLKKLLNAHRDVLFGAHAKSLYPTACDTEKIFWATALSEIDEVYTRRRAGFSSLEEFYTKSSCRYVLNNIDMPIFFLNAEDDPLIHKDLWHYAKEYVMTHEKAVLAVTKHGGHLGFFECEPSHPYAMHPLTWLDKVIVQYGDAVINSSKGE